MLINPVVKKPLSSYLDSQQQSIASQVMREAVGSILVAATNNDADDSSDDSSDDDDDDSSTSSSETMQQLISTSKNKIDSKINDVSIKLISNASPTTITAPATRTSSSSTLTTPATTSNIKKNVSTTKRTNKNDNIIAPTKTTVTMNNNKNNGNNSKKRNNNNNNKNNNSDTKNTPQIVTKATPASKKVVALNTGSLKAQQNSKLNNRQANADLLKSLISSDTSPALPNTSIAVVASPAVEARVAVVTQSSPIVAVVTQSSPIKDRRTQQTRKRKVTELTPDKSKTTSPNKKKK